MREEMEHGFHMQPPVHGTIITGFTPKQTHYPYLKRVVEQIGDDEYLGRIPTIKRYDGNE
jgi:hypothetical protein